jgi:exonuclease III
LIDHVLASPNLKRSLERSDVAHESYVKHCKYQDGTYENRKNIQRHHRPADHRPIWADFKLESVTDA